MMPERDDTYPMPERRRGNGRRANDGANEPAINEEAVWLMLTDLTGTEDRQVIRDIVRSWVRIYEAAHRSRLAAIRMLWSLVGTLTAGLAFLWLQEKAPVLAATLRKIGLMP